MIYKRYKEGIYDIDESEETLIYRLHGIIHRENGPAIIYKKSGRKLFYLEGIEFTNEKEYKSYLRKQKLEKLLHGFIPRIF